MIKEEVGFDDAKNSGGELTIKSEDIIIIKKGVDVVPWGEWTDFANGYHIEQAIAYCLQQSAK